MKFLKFKRVFAGSMMGLALLASCSNNEDSETDLPLKKGDFHVAFANGSESLSATLVQGLGSLSEGVISPSVGYQMESSRTARIFVSSDGSMVYSLNYTVGTIEKLTYHGGDRYTKVQGIDASVPLGVKAVRFTKLNDQVGSVHYIKATAQYEDPNDAKSKYLGHQMIASLGILDLGTMEMKDGYKSELEVKIDEELALQGYYISRIDCPVISGNKLYYGAAVSKYNESTGKSENTDRTFTLVIDYPTLTNATVISTTHVQGATNGYRTPTQHVNEAGEILQLVSGVNATNGKNEVHIAKIVNGQYNTSFNFNLSDLIGKETKSNGFFYAGNGIAYIPYEDLSQEKVQIGVNPQGEPTYSAMWKLARVDLNKNRAVDLNVPDNLWLQQYQTSVVKNGVFHIALSPIGKEGHVYMFNVNSESPDGTLGAKLVGTGADQYYIGIY